MACLVGHYACLVGHYATAMSESKINLPFFQCFLHLDLWQQDTMWKIITFVIF